MALPKYKKSLEAKQGEVRDINPYESAETKAINTIKKNNNTEIFRSLTKEQQQQVKDYIFNGGKGENPMAEARKARGL